MGNLKRLVALWQLLTTQTQLSQWVEASDLETMKRRTMAEGLHFVTVTLPGLYKALDLALREGCFVSPEGFVTAEGKVYPRFLAKAWAAIFTEDGGLRNCNDVNVDAIACIRQLSAIYYKLELPYTEAQTSKVLNAFRQTETDLASLDLFVGTSVPMLTRASKTVRRLLSGVDPDDIVPRHGSGSSACKVIPWERYDSFRFIPRLNRRFPYTRHFFYNMTHLCDNAEMLLNAEVADPHARAVYVPKDSRGPRLISCEPREFMYIQQGLMDLMYKTVDRHPAIAGQIGFTDQVRNQRLACVGSIDGSLATLDLKEASDRVSRDLVRTLFPDNWYTALDASRSKATMLPDGTLQYLHKFAPMGSACCFPVEAICFWSIALAAMPLDDAYYGRLFSGNLRADDVELSVFGDDIIVPTQFVDRVVRALESVGLLVNKDKSYWTGSFRESCGGDFYQGVNVTPVRAKALPVDDNKEARFRTAALFNNLLAKYGTWYNESAFHDLFESWYGPVPKSSRFHTVEPRDYGNEWVIDPLLGLKLIHSGFVSESQAFAGLALKSTYSDIPASYRSRWNKRLCRREYRIPMRRPLDHEVKLDRWGQVLRRELQKHSAETSASLCSLPKRVSYKYGWCDL